MKPTVLNQHDSMNILNSMNNPFFKAAVFFAVALAAMSMLFIAGHIKALIFVSIVTAFLFFMIMPQILRDLRAKKEQEIYDNLLTSGKPLTISQVHDIINYYGAVVLRIDSLNNLIQIKIGDARYKLNISTADLGQLKNLTV